MLVFFSIPVLWEHICILNVRLGGETDQQNVIMHKAYYTRTYVKLVDFEMRLLPLRLQRDARYTVANGENFEVFRDTILTLLTLFTKGFDKLQV